MVDSPTSPEPHLFPMFATAAPSSRWADQAWPARLAPSKACFVGIDIGVDRVNVTSLGRRDCGDGSRPSLGWLSRRQFSMLIDPHAAPPSDWVDIVVDALAQQLPRCIDGDTNIAAVALPVPWIHYQTMQASQREATRMQCDSMFAASILQSRAHLATWPVAADTQWWMVAATAESAACRVAQSIAKVGYDVRCILPHGVALLRAAPGLTSLKPAAALLLDFPGGMIAIQPTQGCGLCRNLPGCSLPPDRRRFLDQLEPWLEEIASEVISTTRYVERLGGTVDPRDPLLICGEATRVPGIDAALAAFLQRPIALWRYAGRQRPHSSTQGSPHDDDDGSMAVSLSLAYCAAQQANAAKGKSKAGIAVQRPAVAGA